MTVLTLRQQAILNLYWGHGVTTGLLPTVLTIEPTNHPGLALEAADLQLIAPPHLINGLILADNGANAPYWAKLTDLDRPDVRDDVRRVLSRVLYPEVAWIHAVTAPVTLDFTALRALHADLITATGFITNAPLLRGVLCGSDLILYPPRQPLIPIQPSASRTDEFEQQYPDVTKRLTETFGNLESLANASTRAPLTFLL